MINLETLYANLKNPPGTKEELQFSAHPVPGHESFRIAKDSAGRPSILVLTSDIPTNPMGSTPVVLEHLKVFPRVRCRIIQEGNQVEEGDFSVLYCTSDDPRLHTYFLRVGSVIISSLGVEASNEQLMTVLSILTDLFRVLSKPARKSVQGLWAELFLIERSRDSTELIRSWHISPEDRFDFNSGAQRIEVKSASGRTRQHTFSLEQLMPPAGTVAVVASIMVNRAGGGVSIDHLVGNISSRLKSVDDILHLEFTIARTLGEDWHHTDDDFFDYELAKQTLEFYDVRSVPSIDHTIPPGVSQVRFQSNLDGAEPIVRQEYRKLGGILKAAIH